MSDGLDLPIMVQPSPRATRHDLPVDILTALGKRVAAPRLPQGDRVDFLLTLWLQAERRRDMVVADADHLAEDLLLELAEIAVQHHMRLWLVSRLADPRRAEMQSIASCVTTAGRMLRTLRASGQPGRVDRLPLADSHFSVFAELTREQLAPHRRRMFDAAWHLVPRRFRDRPLADSARALLYAAKRADRFADARAHLEPGAAAALALAPVGAHAVRDPTPRWVAGATADEQLRRHLVSSGVGEAGTEAGAGASHWLGSSASRPTHRGTSIGQHLACRFVISRFAAFAA